MRRTVSHLATVFTIYCNTFGASDIGSDSLTKRIGSQFRNRFRGELEKQRKPSVLSDFYCLPNK